ncbi:hypothetical protein ACVWWO_002181 [Bradyrhizobium sp. F1.13.1]
MSAAPEPSRPAPDVLDAAADQAIAACGGDAREAVKALIVANGFLEAQVEELLASVSAGYSRGRFGLSRDRKDWYD